jgi:hypothetical protein
MACIRQEEKTRADFRTHRYIVCFVEREGRNWWDWFFRTRLGFRHCFVVQWCEWTQRWIMVDWRKSRTDFTVFFDFEIEAFLRQMRVVHGTVVELTPPEREDDAGGLLTYCSNIISRFMGLGNTVILTPYGLYRRILAAGGEVVYSWRDEDEQQSEADSRTERT